MKRNYIKYEVEDGYLTFDIKKQAVTRCSMGITYLKIPEKIDCINVLSVEGINGNEKITSIEISEGVTKIENSAFTDCVNLRTIKLLDGLKYICRESFCRCSNLSDVNIPDSVKYIGASAFNSCSLKSIHIPANVSYVGMCAFLNNDLFDITVDEDNKNYKAVDGVLYNKSMSKLIRCADNIEKVNIPNTVREIADHAFQGCNNIKDINIPYGVKKIGNFAFAGCPQLSSVIIPESVAEMKDNIFVLSNEELQIFVEDDSFADIFLNGCGWCEG